MVVETLEQQKKEKQKKLQSLVIGYHSVNLVGLNDNGKGHIIRRQQYNPRQVSMVGVKSLIALAASGQLEHQSNEPRFHVALLVDENFIDKSKLVKDINVPRYTHIPWIRLDEVKSARDVASLMDGNHRGVALEQWLAPAIKERDLCKAQLDKQPTNKKLEETLETLQTTVDQKGLMSCTL